MKSQMYGVCIPNLEISRVDDFNIVWRLFELSVRRFARNFTMFELRMFLVEKCCIPKKTKTKNLMDIEL